MTSNLIVLKALAHESRLRLVDALLSGPLSVEDLAGRLNLAPSTVSHHLKKLEAAGIAQCARDQYYAIYSLTDDCLDRSLRELVSTAPLDRQAQTDRQTARDALVLSRFFERGQLRQMPRQKKKRDLVLDFFAAGFEPGRTYAEREVDEVIRRHYDDHCTVRRHLVDRGTFTRHNGQYRLHPDLGEQEHRENMSRRNQLINDYRQKPRVAGIYRITHTASGRSLWGRSVNVRGRLNRHRAELGMGTHPVAGLQTDWTQGLSAALEMEVLDSVEERFEPDFVLADELAVMAQLWAERLPHPEETYA